MLFLRVFTLFIVQPLVLTHEKLPLLCPTIYIRIVQETGWKSVDWIHLAQDMDKW